MDGTGIAAKSVRNVADASGEASFQFSCDERAVPGVSPGLATILALVGDPAGKEASEAAHAIITLIGPPASLTIAASPARLTPGEVVTVTVTVKDAIGQDVLDGTWVDLDVKPPGRLTPSRLETRRGSATAFLLTSDRHAGLYIIIASTNGITATASVATKLPVS